MQEVEARRTAGSFETPEWDPISQKKVRDALIQLAATLPDTRNAFGTKDTTEPVRRLICAASAWGGNPEKDALYLNVVPAQNDGATVYAAHGARCARRRILVGDRLQRGGLLHA